MLTPKFTDKEQALYEILTDPIWFGEFLRSFNDFPLTKEERQARPFSYRWYQKDLLTGRDKQVLLRGGRAVGKCHPDSTRIYTVGHGYIKIKDLIELYGLNEPFLIYSPSSDGTMRHAIGVIFEDAVVPVYKIKTKRGYVVECSGNHPIYCNNDWVLAEDIKPGDKVLTVNKLPWDSTQKAFSWYELRWMGYVFDSYKSLPGEEMYLPFQEQVKDFSTIATYYGFPVERTGEHTYRINVMARTKDSVRSSLLFVMNLLGMRKLQAYRSITALPKILMDESLDQIKVFLEPYLSKHISIDGNYVYIDFPFTYIGQRAVWKQFMELLLRFGVATVVTTHERDNVIIRTATVHDSVRLFTAFDIPGYTMPEASLQRATFPWFVYDEVVEVTLEKPKQTYAVEVVGSQVYFADNIVVHNSVVIQDKLVFMFFNAPECLPETPEVLLMTANTNQLTPLLDSLRMRFTRSPLLQGRLSNVNLSKGTIDFKYKQRTYRLHTRIAGQRGENNVVGLHVPFILIDEAQLFPLGTWTQLQPVLNQWEERTQFFIAGVPNGLQDSVLYVVDTGDPTWKKYVIPATENPYWSREDHERAKQRYGGEQSDDFRRLVLGEHGEAVFSVITYDAIKTESYPFYSYVYKDVDRMKRRSFEHALGIPKLPHDAQPLYFSIDTGFNDPTVIQLIGFFDNVWRTYARWKLIRIPFNEQASIIHYLAGKYKLDGILIDFGAGGGGMGIAHTLQSDTFPNNTFYKQYVYGVQFNSLIDIGGERAQAKSMAGEYFTQLVREHNLVFSQIDAEGIDQISRIAYERRSDGTHKYYIISPHGGKSNDDHIFASYIVWTIHLLQTQTLVRQQPRSLLRAIWV